jgi:alpha-beta hydrolase superfamily lysophospholipase
MTRREARRARPWYVRLLSVAVKGLIALVALWLVLSFVGAALLCQPRRADIPDRKELQGKPVENVIVRTDDGLDLSAWYVRASEDRAVILLAGIGANRLQCVSRGEFYLAQGYSVLMPDLRATGKSEGRKVSIGWYERKDLAACYRYLHDAGYQHIGVDGISLGAATICYSLKDSPDYAFVVLESCYDTIEHALKNRLDMYHVPYALSYPTQWITVLWLRVSPKQLRPIDYMAYCKAPTLVLGGDVEQVLQVSETQEMFDRCAAEKKRLFIFEGARHEDFLGHFSSKYKQEMRAFLGEVSATWPKPAKSE